MHKVICHLVLHHYLQRAYQRMNALAVVLLNFLPSLPPLTLFLISLSFSATPEFALARRSLRRIETRQSTKKSIEDCGDGITPMLARALKKKFEVLGT